ncbi:hypothetical protein ACFFJ4_17315 [Xanthomonas dyei]|uniref:hypothetical protein n=1 Tax=Xanthomonas dyei TaxID=743699 RepID=UPI0011B0AD65|nr:hypothetical protein [Xanthomonas dyei]
MDQEQTDHFFWAESGITLIVLATTKINIEFARDVCSKNDAVVIGSPDSMLAAGIDDLSFLTPMQGLQTVKNYFSRPAGSLCVLSFSDQLIRHEDCGIYLAKQGEFFGVSTFEIIFYSKYLAKVFLKRDGYFSSIKPYCGLKSQYDLIESIVGLIKFYEEVEGSLAARFSRERLRKKHIGQELFRIIEYKSKVLDCHYRGVLSSKKTSYIMDDLKSIEREARKEISNG